MSIDIIFLNRKKFNTMHFQKVHDGGGKVQKQKNDGRRVDFFFHKAFLNKLN